MMWQMRGEHGASIDNGGCVSSHIDLFLWDGPPLFPGIRYDAGARKGKERTDVYIDPWC